ncbi:MAG: DUF4232 domain-containing protein [Acidimicrobiales bacterium]
MPATCQGAGGLVDEREEHVLKRSLAVLAIGAGALLVPARIATATAGRAPEAAAGGALGAAGAGAARTSAAIAASTARQPRTNWCRASHLKGTFTSIPDSAGAGNIVYRLRLESTARSVCDVSGIFGMRLVGRHGQALPTHARAAHPARAGVLVRLAPGASAWLAARFSPDVPGTGEPVNRACEPTAYHLRVFSVLTHGTVISPIAPPTPVCEHGTMSMSPLSPKRPTA